jgi:hypothetical protein
MLESRKPILLPGLLFLFSFYPYLNGTANRSATEAEENGDGGKSTHQKEKEAGVLFTERG